jgi:membrane protein required for colicin V production
MLPSLAAVDLRWLDVLGLAIVLYFLVVGVKHGLWWQLVRLLGIVASVAIARAVVPRIAPRFAAAFPDLDERLAGGIVWTTIILLGLLVVALVGRLGKESLEATPLAPIDRIGGGVAGAITGVLVHAAIVLCLCQTTQKDWSVAAVRGTASQRLVAQLGSRVPLFLDAHAADTLEPWLEAEREASVPESTAPAGTVPVSSGHEQH